MNVQQALEVASKGIRIFPVLDKVPPKDVKWQSQASSDASVIEGWNAKWPNCDWAMPVPPKGIVVDIDDPDGFALDPLDLPATVTQTTPRGGSHHLYKTDGRDLPQTIRAYHPALDTRVAGKGYIVLYQPDVLKSLEQWADAPAWIYEDPKYAGHDSGGQHGELVKTYGYLKNAHTPDDTAFNILWRMAKGFPVLNPSRPWRESDIWTILRSGDLWNAPARATAVLLADLDASPPPPLLLGRLHPLAHTILFGNGGVGKGALASSWIAKLEKVGIRTLIVDFERNDTEWAGRTKGLGLSGLDTWYMDPIGTLWDVQDDIKAIVEERSIDYLVIDSMIPALGDSDYASPEGARKYAASLLYIGKPALSLAHVNRAGDHSSPFGSAFHKNLCRLMWSLEDRGENKILTQRKNNNYEPTPPQQITLMWDMGKLVHVVELGYAQVLTERIKDAITFLGPSSIADIVTQLNDNLALGEVEFKTATIKSALYRSKQFASDNATRNPKWEVVA
jgi:hypothetical protein